MLVHLYTGTLPWMYVRAETDDEVNQQLLEIKRTISASELCAGLPDEFAHFFRYIRSLDFEERPDYIRWRRAFGRAFKRHKFEYDNVYDWTKKLFHELRAEKAKREKEIQGAIIIEKADKTTQTQQDEDAGKAEPAAKKRRIAPRKQVAQ